MTPSLALLGWMGGISCVMSVTDPRATKLEVLLMLGTIFSCFVAMATEAGAQEETPDRGARGNSTAVMATRVVATVWFIAHLSVFSYRFFVLS